ncbi:VanZ family protein [Tetragenococcus koreensis]|uniref:VanZ family protein n=1 Tax=Tetragenococcus koreensis TaxID=290335 RepID=UPI001F25577C|nr:VanZ family protein [Tetragenococcus koreensis]MCF1615240.1 VanZ family protein [Tetragenococcus koreensis]MCF1625036.1 VanZ family protein [Tetragenococcus koreensis]MCF1628091.1 VanZ family protein [Tetragenococcus koreensis]
MARSIRCILALIISTVLGIGVIQYLAYPTLLQYDRFANVMNRFGYTKETLILFVVLSCWLLYLQIEFRRFSIIYLYLFYSVYLFLLFVVLFAKAPEYHTFNGDLFDFLVWDRGTLIEALLNLVYFIPLGGLYGLRANWLEFGLISLLTITGIETIQYVFYIGTFSVSDILLNFLGCLVGYSICLVLRKYMDKNVVQKRTS